jgi:hypothetical protein
MSPNVNRVLVGLGLVFGVVLAVFAFGITGVVMQVAFPLVVNGDIPFMFGGIIIVALAAAAVAIAGTGFFRGMPFHIFGVMGPFTVGSVFDPFRELIVTGPLIYLAAWCWSFLGESGYRLLRSRRPAPSPDSDAPGGP